MNDFFQFFENISSLINCLNHQPPLSRPLYYYNNEIPYIQLLMSIITLSFKVVKFLYVPTALPYKSTFEIEHPIELSIWFR
jgi:hypothetical protein